MRRILCARGACSWGEGWVGMTAGHEAHSGEEGFCGGKHRQGRRGGEGGPATPQEAAACSRAQGNDTPPQLLNS